MNDKKEKVSLGTTVLDPIVKGYQVGGMALALILVGTALLLTAVISEPGAVSYICASVGAVTILAILSRLYFVDMNKAKNLRDNMKDNEDLLNSIQDTAIQMTELSSHLQSLAFKHADKVGPVVAQVRNTVKLVTDIPLVGNTDLGKKVAGLADHETVRDAEQLSLDIVEYTEAAKEVIEDVRVALTQLDPEPIKEYRARIEVLDDQLKLILKKSA